jgi:hypothetical protein
MMDTVCLAPVSAILKMVSPRHLRWAWSIHLQDDSLTSWRWLLADAFFVISLWESQWWCLSFLYVWRWLSFRVGLRETLIEVKTTLLTWACKAQNIPSFTSCWPSKRHKAGLFQRPSTQWVSWEWVLQLSVAFECLWCLLTSDLEPQMGSPGQGTKSTHKCTSHKTVR